MNKQELINLLREEELICGAKMGYVIDCYKHGDWYWKNGSDKITADGMIIDLIHEDILEPEELKELIEDKAFHNTTSCCNSYYAIDI